MVTKQMKVVYNVAENIVDGCIRRRQLRFQLNNVEKYVAHTHHRALKRKHALCSFNCSIINFIINDFSFSLCILKI